MTSEERLVIAKVEDIVRLCGKYSCARFSQFLDGGEIALIKDEFHFPYDCNYMFYGGYDESERMLLGVFPEWEEPSGDAFPITVLKIQCSFKNELTHRDYLGTLMSLGLERSKMGDIIVGDGYAYVFVCTDFAEYIKENIRKIGNKGVKTEIIELDGFVAPKRRYEEIETVCASMRIDAVTAAAAKLSRQDAARLIEEGKVKLNHREVSDGSKTLFVNDLLSIRGFGRFIVADAGGETRKGRQHITLKKSI